MKVKAIAKMFDIYLSSKYTNIIEELSCFKHRVQDLNTFSPAFSAFLNTYRGIHIVAVEQ